MKLPSPHGRMNARSGALTRGMMLGIVLGALAGGGAAGAFGPSTHIAALWGHGMGVEGGNAHPYLQSTDGAARQGSASHQWCSSGAHGVQSEYISTHIHQPLSISPHQLVEAHIGSQQTGLSHHAHHNC
jgi:hypothetical protein